MLNIILCFNENYAKFGAVLMKSIIDNIDTSKSIKDFCADNLDKNAARGGGNLSL